MFVLGNVGKIPLTDVACSSPPVSIITDCWLCWIWDSVLFTCQVIVENGTIFEQVDDRPFWTTGVYYIGTDYLGLHKTRKRQR
jgi:hypothetical protein